MSVDGVRTDLSKIDVPSPTGKSTVRNILGLEGYYRQFIKGFVGISAPLQDITSPKTPFDWTDEAQLAFVKLKYALTFPAVLGYPEFNKPFVVKTDVSSTGVGAVLAK